MGRGGERYPVDCEIPADDPFVSRQHFLLEICPPRVFGKDLSFTNPLSVNGRPVREIELHDGDVVEVGFTQLRVSVIQLSTCGSIRASDVARRSP